jgi:ribose 1,5-bisphosphokinase
MRMPDQQPQKIGPGRLVLVVGPSGAGKDTLIDLVRAACAGDDAIVFARRVVTRAASASENNVSVTPAEFSQALMRGDFAMHWEAHGLCYALPRAIDEDVGVGRTVVANVSRTVIAALRERYDAVAVVSVTAPAEVLAARLALRGRSSDGPITERLRRDVGGAASAPDVVISNIASPQDHARELLGVIRDRRPAVAT